MRAIVGMLLIGLACDWPEGAVLSEALESSLLDTARDQTAKGDKYYYWPGSAQGLGRVLACYQKAATAGYGLALLPKRWRYFGKLRRKNMLQLGQACAQGFHNTRKPALRPAQYREPPGWYQAIRP